MGVWHELGMIIWVGLTHNPDDDIEASPRLMGFNLPLSRTSTTKSSSPSASISASSRSTFSNLSKGGGSSGKSKKFLGRFKLGRKKARRECMEEEARVVPRTPEEERYEDWLLARRRRHQQWCDSFGNACIATDVPGEDIMAGMDANRVLVRVC
jgi:hypothetical protein